MSEKPKEFWNLDLKKLTWSGWLLMVLAIATVVGVGIAMLALLEALGVRRNPADNQGKRWVGALALLPAVAAGYCVFEAGRRLCKRSGLSILRPDPPAPEQEALHDG